MRSKVSYSMIFFSIYDLYIYTLLEQFTYLHHLNTHFQNIEPIIQKVSSAKFEINYSVYYALFNKPFSFLYILIKKAPSGNSS